MRHLDKFAKALIAPAVIASILVAFMTLTYIAAWLLTHWLSSKAILYAAWVITTLAGGLLVRQLSGRFEW